jgi:hypothetical protein
MGSSASIWLLQTPAAETGRSRVAGSKSAARATHFDQTAEIRYAPRDLAESVQVHYCHCLSQCTRLLPRLHCVLLFQTQPETII